MQLGMIGLGRMGANMVRRLLRNQHTCVVYDRNPGAVTELKSAGAQGGAAEQFWHRWRTDAYPERLLTELAKPLLLSFVF